MCHQKFHPTLTLPHQGEGNKESSAAIILSGGYFLSCLGAGAASCLHMVPVSLQAGHFLGLQRVSTLLPHFSQVKTAMITPPNQIKPPLLATAGQQETPRLSRSSHDLGGHIIMNNTWFRQDMFKGTAGRALRLKNPGFREGQAPTGWKPVPLTKNPWPPTLHANSPAPPLIPIGDKNYFCHSECSEESLTRFFTGAAFRMT